MFPEWDWEKVDNRFEESKSYNFASDKMLSLVRYIRTIPDLQDMLPVVSHDELQLYTEKFSGTFDVSQYKYMAIGYNTDMHRFYVCYVDYDKSTTHVYFDDIDSDMVAEMRSVYTAVKNRKSL